MKFVKKRPANTSFEKSSTIEQIVAHKVWDAVREYNISYFHVLVDVQMCVTLLAYLLQ